MRVVAAPRRSRSNDATARTDRLGGVSPGRQRSEIAHFAFSATCGSERDAGSARSAGEQQHLARRMGPWRPGRSSGGVKDADDVVGVGDDLDDAHPAAALAAYRDVDGEDPGEEGSPPEAAGPRRRLGRGVGAVIHGASEAERELLLGCRDGRRWNDASTEMMAICEHPKIAGHVKTGRGHECA